MFENSGSNKKCWFCPNSSHMLYKKFLIFFRFRKSKWDFEKYFSSHFIEMRILRWESHLSSPKWELWTENLISLRVKWDFEMRIFFLTSERRFWDEILISKYHLPRSEKIITKEILFWTSLEMIPMWFPTPVEGRDRRWNGRECCRIFRDRKCQRDDLCQNCQLQNCQSFPNSHTIRHRSLFLSVVFADGTWFWVWFQNRYLLLHSNKKPSWFFEYLMSPNRT